MNGQIPKGLHKHYERYKGCKIWKSICAVILGWSLWFFISLTSTTEDVPVKIFKKIPAANCLLKLKTPLCSHLCTRLTGNDLELSKYNFKIWSYALSVVETGKILGLTSLVQNDKVWSILWTGKVTLNRHTVNYISSMSTTFSFSPIHGFISLTRPMMNPGFWPLTPRMSTSCVRRRQSYKKHSRLRSFAYATFRPEGPPKFPE